MSVAGALTAQIKTALETVAPVYLFNDKKLDTACAPFILLSLESDDMLRFVGTVAHRSARYQIDLVLSREFGLLDLQQKHFEILQALTLGALPSVRATENGWPFEASATVDPDQDGSTWIRLQISVAFGYVEKY